MILLFWWPPLSIGEGAEGPRAHILLISLKGSQLCLEILQKRLKGKREVVGG